MRSPLSPRGNCREQDNGEPAFKIRRVPSHRCLTYEPCRQISEEYEKFTDYGDEFRLHSHGLMQENWKTIRTRTSIHQTCWLA